MDFVLLVVDNAGGEEVVGINNKFSTDNISVTENVIPESDKVGNLATTVNEPIVQFEATVQTIILGGIVGNALRIGETISGFDLNTAFKLLEAENSKKRNSRSASKKGVGVFWFIILRKFQFDTFL